MGGQRRQKRGSSRSVKGWGFSKRLRLLNPLEVSKHFEAPKLPKHAFCLRKTFRKRCKHVFLSLGSLLEPGKREHHEHQRPPPGHPKPPETRRLYVLERLRAHQTPKSKTPNALKRIRGPAVRVFCRHEAVRARKMSDFRGVFTWTHKTLGIYEVFCCWNTPPNRAS